MFISGKSYNLENSVNSWDKEKQDYTYDTKTCTKDKVCGHYTQVRAS